MRTKALSAQIFGADRELVAAMDANDFHVATSVLDGPTDYIVGKRDNAVKQSPERSLTTYIDFTAEDAKVRGGPSTIRILLVIMVSNRGDPLIFLCASPRPLR